MDEQAFDDLLELYRWRFGIDDPSLLDWTGTMRVRPKITDPPVRDVRPTAPARNTVVFGPSGDRLSHPDRSVQLVVVGEGASPAVLAEAGRVARDAVITWARDGAVAVRWLREPDSDRPVVSVLVHTAGEGDDLDACLHALAAATPVTGAIELLVADAGATGAAAAVARRWASRRPLSYVRADPAHGAAGARNDGADVARGELLVFVGDRTRVLPGWLRPLVRTLRDEPAVGVVGGRLVAEDGALAAAGGVLFADGSLAGFGRGTPDADGPLAGSARDVDYVPGDLLATRTGLLRRLGGLDGGFDAGYEDVDYCLRVRAAGRRVTYQPQSVAVAPAAPATAPAAEGHRRFVRRWATPLAGRPERPAHFDAATWDRLARSATT